MRDEDLVAHSFKEDQALESEEIQRIIPHRYPFLLVDRIVEI